MNYGKFFRLNKHLSRIEDGFAIYDYIDLPAYFTPSKDNLMSPKYPISVIIMGDSVVFKLHYSAYKIEKVSKQDAQDESIKGYSNYPQYVYNIEAPSLISENKVKGGDTTKIVHMEEIILELPFTDTVGRSLSDTIRDIYDTQFPLIQRDNGKDSDLSSKEKSSGGRYLEKLIRTRYLEEKVDEVKDVNSHFYESLRKISDGTASYSTLWLMGLVKGDKNGVRYRRTDKKGNVIGFLRKLLLDFMFDLKHSDVFQNSVHYQKMYSGLMADFFFSALMHKCEYYYYRKLTRQTIKKIEESDVDKNEKRRRKKTIAALYASELVKAEELWVKDIMNPLSETTFVSHVSMKSQTKKNDFKEYSFKKKIKWFLKRRDNVFRPWNSWFAEPEEEMRRVCFPMVEMTDEADDAKIHICNSDTLKEYLDITPDKGDEIDVSMNFSRSDMREKISKWFLKRYDFDGVVHFHMSRPLNWLLYFFLIFLGVFLYNIPHILCTPYKEIGREHVQYYFPLLIFLLLFVATYAIYYCKWRINHNAKDPMLHAFNDLSFHRINILGIIIVALAIGINNTYLGILFVLAIIFRKVINLFVPIFFVILITIIFAIEDSVHKVVTISAYLSVFTMIIVIFDINKWEEIYSEISFYFKKITSYLHLFLPRLVASITAAWITLTVGFDLYAAFFDSPVSWPTGIFIGSVVLLFIMYEINRIASSCSVGRKISRSVELLLISYTISLIVGIVVIDFVGARFVDRGGFEDIFVKEYKHELKNESEKYGNLKGTLKLSGLPKADELATTESIKTKIVKFRFGEHDVFYMRDFLFMFAFIAMFIGIFLQMIIFEEKQMTEL